MAAFPAYYVLLPLGRHWWKPLLAYGATFCRVEQGPDGSFTDIPIAPEELAEGMSNGCGAYRMDLAGVPMTLQVSIEPGDPDGLPTLSFYGRRFLPLEQVRIAAELGKPLYARALRNGERLFGRVLLASGAKEYDECTLCRSIFRGGAELADRALSRVENSGATVVRTPANPSAMSAHRAGRALDETAVLGDSGGAVKVYCGFAANAVGQGPAGYIAVDLEKRRRRASVRLAATFETFLIEAGARPLDVLASLPVPMR